MNLPLRELRYATLPLDSGGGVKCALRIFFDFGTPKLTGSSGLWTTLRRTSQHAADPPDGMAVEQMRVDLVA